MHLPVKSLSFKNKSYSFPGFIKQTELVYSCVNCK